jgi:NADP-dependent 3-hydroxy acid dehydrogenase YdfG
VALVTGASSGIGASIAKLLVQNGMTVFGVARAVERVQALAKELEGYPGKLEAMKCDVTSEDDIKAVFASAKQSFGGVDVVINNAGLCHMAPLLSESSSTAEWRNMAEVNILAPCIITREFMTQIKERNLDDGHIFMISSVVGHVVPKAGGAHFYSATKFAATAVAEGIRQELREAKSNIRLTSLSPGYVKTEFFGRAIKTDDMASAIAASSQFVYNDLILEPDDVASAVVFALAAPPRMEVNDMIIRATGQDL